MPTHHQDTTGDDSHGRAPWERVGLDTLPGIFTLTSLVTRLRVKIPLGSAHIM